MFSFFLIRSGRPNAANSNVFALLESQVICWQFYQWKLFERRQKLFYLLLAGFFIIWLIENFVLSTLHQFNSYFIIIRAFVIVLMSISTINNLIVFEQGQLLKNAVFLICIGFIVYFTFSIMVETFWLYGLNQSKIFRNHIYEILAYINLLANLIYALAILWMPMKRKFILPF